jgi:hypothetical protein
VNDGLNVNCTMLGLVGIINEYEYIYSSYLSYWLSAQMQAHGGNNCHWKTRKLHTTSSFTSTDNFIQSDGKYSQPKKITRSKGAQERRPASTIPTNSISQEDSTDKRLTIIISGAPQITRITHNHNAYTIQTYLVE